MIASLSGVVEAVSPTRAVISVGGVGIEFFATPGTLASLREGQEARVCTSLVVKEDSLTLFGFETEDERDVFNVLLTVSGIGPRIALAVLAVHPPNNLRAAIAAKNERALTQVPGIGKKGAQRMILEIGDKLGPAVGESIVSEDAGAPEQNAGVVEALVNLGWPERLAADAIAQAQKEQGNLSIPELLRAALQILGKHR